MARESHFNRIAPFSKAPLAYGFGLVLLLLSLGITAICSVGGRRSWALRSTVWGWLGIMAGVALELYGFLLGFRVFGQVPVTNMYETVIWVALATSILGLALELLWRKKYSALAAGGIALLATVLAESVRSSTRVPRPEHAAPGLASPRGVPGANQPLACGPCPSDRLELRGICACAGPRAAGGRVTTSRRPIAALRLP